MTASTALDVLVATDLVAADLVAAAARGGRPRGRRDTDSSKAGGAASAGDVSDSRCCCRRGGERDKRRRVGCGRARDEAVATVQRAAVERGVSHESGDAEGYGGAEERGWCVFMWSRVVGEGWQRRSDGRARAGVERTGAERAVTGLYSVAGWCVWSRSSNSSGRAQSGGLWSCSRLTQDGQW